MRGGEIRKRIERLREFVRRGQDLPLDVFARRLRQMLTEIDRLCPEQEKPRWQQECFSVLAPLLERSFILRHIIRKPFGYAGDFLAMEFIYANEPVTEESFGRFLERYLLSQPACEAVRERKQVFVQEVLKLAALKKPAQVLSIPCGSCREVFEALNQLLFKEAPITFHCVDQEERALYFASELLSPANGQVLLERANAFRFNPGGRTYDLIWVAGLLDYLNEKAAALLLRRLKKHLKEGGKLLAGNFHPSNPNRLEMEWLLNWRILYRDEGQMLRIAERAGMEPQRVKIKKLCGGIFVLIEYRS